jgi:Ca2+-binding RTX toxin-like protein
MPQIVVGNFAVEIGVGSNADAYGDWAVTEANASTITLHYPDVGVDEHFYGNFLYDGTGNLAGGTLTAYDQVLNGQYVVQVTDLNLSATQVASAMAANDTGRLLQLALGGNDSIVSNIFDDTIYSGPGNDTVIAFDGYDEVDGGDGNDDLNGNRGDDTVHGGIGADFVRGGQGSDLVFGDDGDDLHVNGNIGADTVHGGNGADSVYGGQGNDLVYGDAGND